MAAAEPRESLGSAAATYLTKELCDSGGQPSGLILDAPLTNIFDAAQNHPITLPYWPVLSLLQNYVLEAFEVSKNFIHV